MAAVLIVAKGVLLGAPSSPQWLGQLAVISWRDVLFAGGFAVLAWCALRWLKGEGLPLAAGAFCVAFGVANVGAFDYFLRPLTYDLFKLMEGVAAVRSSVGQRITLPLALAFIGAPIFFLVAVRWSVARLRPRVAVLAMASWMVLGIVLHRWDESLEPRHHLALSPHLESFRTLWRAHTSWGRPGFAKTYPPEDALEFRPFGERASSGRETGFYDPPAGVHRPENLILIVLESVGTKYLSLYGSEYDTTPHLVAEAENSLVFKDFYANAGFTYAAFRPVNFGVYSGLPWSYMPWEGRALPEPLAAGMKARGRRTAYLHNGELNWGQSRFLLEESGSFDVLNGYEELGCERISSWGVADRCSFARLVRWIDEKPGQPFCATVWTDQTHDPYPLEKGISAADFFAGKPKPPHAEDLARYLTLVREVDRQIGLLFEALRQRGLDRNTLVAITGDHGEAFADPHEQRGHAFTLYEEELRVPLVLWSPALFHKVPRHSSIGAQVDLLPTLADILGLPAVSGWQGHSLFDPTRPQRAFLSSVSGEYLFGVREGRWKYIFDATNGIEFLYDLEGDPHEQRNVVKENATLAERQRQRISAWVNFEEDFVRGRK